MSRAFKSIRKGLDQAIAHEEGRLPGLRVHRVPVLDVKAVREKTGLTQLEFAARFAISPGTLRHWERGDRRPRGTALVLLCIIDREPRAVLRALGDPN
ncbi:MAG: helix-turn-helix domain-containing protein [Betaproteobacteria bacterium]